MKIVLASRNQDKYREIKDILKHTKVELVSAEEFNVPEIIEDGATYFENAKKKAFYTSTHTQLPAISDDTGLEVFALGKTPGVYSSRYAGKNASYSDNVKKLLREMQGKTDRRARFVCVCVLCFPDGTFYQTRGEIRGIITKEPIGRGGFGYDPVFYIPELKKTFAELSLEEKNKISHRAKAFKKMAQLIEKLKPEK